MWRNDKSQLKRDVEQIGFQLAIKTSKIVSILWPRPWLMHVYRHKIYYQIMHTEQQRMSTFNRPKTIRNTKLYLRALSNLSVQRQFHQYKMIQETQHNKYHLHISVDIKCSICINFQLTQFIWRHGSIIKMWKILIAPWRP